MRYYMVLLISVFLLNILNGQIQNGVATYEVLSKPLDLDSDVLRSGLRFAATISNDSFKINDEIEQTFINLFERMGDDEGQMHFHTVSFNEKRSFSTFGRKKSPAEILENPSYANLKKMMGEDICYEISGNKITYNTTWKDTLYSVSSMHDFVDWEFTDKKKIINGYSCSEAIIRNTLNKEEVTQRVWYSDDISLPYGPSKFIGFPGLVMFVSGIGVDYRISDIKVDQVEVDCILDGIPISEKDLTAKKYTNPINWQEYLKKNNQEKN